MSEPTISQQILDHQGQREKLAAFFREHDLEDLWPEDFILLVGPNYRSRISDCVTKLHMRIVNVPRFREWTDKSGKVRRQRLIGGYRYESHERLGRDAGELVTARWNETGAYQDDSFRLT